MLPKKGKSYKIRVYEKSYRLDDCCKIAVTPVEIRSYVDTGCKIKGYTDNNLPDELGKLDKLYWDQRCWPNE